MSAIPIEPGGPAEPSPLETGGGRLGRRKAVNRGMEGVATLAALLAVGVLVIMVGSVLFRGLGSFTADFFTKTQGLFGETGGGIAHAIVGSAVIVALAALIAVPVGVLVAIYTSEFAQPRFAQLVQLCLDVLNGIPSIVIGIFIFGLLVVGHGQSGWAVSVALAIIMLPLVARSTQEVLTLVPHTLREAALGIGISKWRMVLGVVLPASLGGILTGASLAVARVAGETAPVIIILASPVTNRIIGDPSKSLQTIPALIFSYSESPDPADHGKAWAAAILLIGFVLVTSLGSRMLMTRMRRRMEGGQRSATFLSSVVTFVRR